MVLTSVFISALNSLDTTENLRKAAPMSGSSLDNAALPNRSSDRTKHISLSTCAKRPKQKRMSVYGGLGGSLHVHVQATSAENTYNFQNCKWLSPLSSISSILRDRIPVPANRGKRTQNYNTLSARINWIIHYIIHIIHIHLFRLPLNKTTWRIACMAHIQNEHW